ncbi:MAG: MBL fold metallo-hydrolase [Caldilineaceae bacterium]|nr:MBL fold metallo-hydrolase [Caldilineaceae bacterium]
MSDLIAHMQRTQIIPNSLAIWGLGQIGVAVKGPEGILYIDPCLSDVVREQFGDWWQRAYDPPLLPEEITNADYYLITHEHLDHLDPLTVGPAALASPEARFIAPGWCVDLLVGLGIESRRVIVPPVLEPIHLAGTSLTLTIIPSAHYDKEFDAEKGYRWFGYLIEWNGVTFYHAGDTIIYPDYIETLKMLPTPDLALMPVNGRDYYRETDAGAVGNLLPVEAARLARDLGWDTLIPGHNDLYPNNAIPNAQIVAALETVAPRQKYKFLQPGELYYYVKGA